LGVLVPTLLEELRGRRGAARAADDAIEAEHDRELAELRAAATRRPARPSHASPS